MSAFVVTDASLWAARLIEGDVFHHTSREWLARARTEGTIFVAPALLLVDVSAAILRRTGEADLARRTVEGLKNLPELRLVTMDAALVENAAQVAAQLGLRAADAFYVSMAEQLEIPLVTFDDDQQQRAARLVMIERIGMV